MNNYPSKVSFHYPIKCNLQCKQCNLWKFQFTKSRLWKYKKSTVLKLYNWIGKFTLSLTGGEPFLIKDFVDFLFFCDKLGIETSVNSNATLIDEKLAFKLSKLKYFNLTISLDGPNAKTHDYLRGVKGTFNKAKKAIKLLNENGFNKLTMNTILSKKNIDLIEEILFFSKKNKIKIMFVPVVLNRFRNNLKNKKEFENHELWPNKNLALKKINKIISFKKSLNTLI